VDGSETGWDRSAEPAPRWRTLLDRARLGSRGQDRGDDQHRGAPEPADEAPAPRAIGYSGRASIGYPAEADQEPDRWPRSGREYGAGYGYRPEEGHGADPALRPPYGGQTRASRAVPGVDPASGYSPDRTARGGYGADPAVGYGADPAAGYGDLSAPRGGYGTEPASGYDRAGVDEYDSGAEFSSRGYGSSRYAELGSLSDGYRDPEPEPPGVAVDRYSRSAAPEPADVAVDRFARPLTPEQPGAAVNRHTRPAVAAPQPPGIPDDRYARPPAPAPRSEPDPAESRYSLLDRGYPPQEPPLPSRYALLDTGYQPEPAYRAAYPTAPQQPPGLPPAPAPAPVAAAYPVRTRARRPEPEPEPKQSGEVQQATETLRRDLGRPQVLAFANPKGGVHKTTATVLAAATIGSVRGRGVLAWDDNELRGTLGLRAGSARHARTIRHLVSDLATVEIRNGADLNDCLDQYLRHAADGSYDVLAGEESPRFAERLDQHTVGRVIELLRRTHEVICVDTGNNVESANWRAVMQAADQLVLTTVPREDAAFSGDWMLEVLHEVGLGDLADNAVTLISCPTPGRSPLQDDLERHFAGRTRAVAVVPYDPALEAGSSIEYQNLQPGTRDAWLKAAATMLEPYTS